MAPEEIKQEILEEQTEENGAENEQEEDELLKTMTEKETGSQGGVLCCSLFMFHTSVVRLFF